MRRTSVLVLAAATALAPALAWAIASPNSNWIGDGLMTSRLGLGPASDTWKATYSTGLYIDQQVIDLGNVDLGAEMPAALTFTTGKTTRSRARTAARPRDAERTAIRQKLYELYGVQRVDGQPKALDVGTLGDVEIDDTTIRTVGGFTAIKKFTKVRGSVSVTWIGTLLDGPNTGKKVKGRVKFSYSGDRD